MPLLSPQDLAGTQPGMLRDGSASFAVVREEDLPSSPERITRAELVRLTIPMLPPKGHDVRRWPRLRGTARGTLRGPSTTTLMRGAQMAELTWSVGASLASPTFDRCGIGAMAAAIDAARRRGRVRLGPSRCILRLAIP